MYLEFLDDCRHAVEYGRFKELKSLEENEPCLMAEKVIK